jgi:hypothetical protein
MRTQVRAQGFLLLMVFFCSGIAVAGGKRPAPSGNAVTQWSGVAMEVLPVSPGLLADSRALAIVHASIHDAVNGVQRRYQPYTADLSSPGASVEAAIASAARTSLQALAPGQEVKVEIAYHSALLAIPDGAAKTAGIELGQKAAAANLDRRLADGFDTATQPAYVSTGTPGDYDFTPPFDVPPLGPGALFPGWGRITPFAIDLMDHKLKGPLPLTSREYARDFEYLKSVGKSDSRTRTAEQTDIANFWFEFSPLGWNRIANTIVMQKRIDVWRSARIMALVNFAIADGYIAGFDAKYHFRFWRPVTAIRRAATDGNPATQADPSWLPLSAPAFFTPPVPDYPSTHTVLGAAVAEVLIRNFGDNTRFSVISTTLPGAIREFSRFSDAAKENGMSRAYGGIHFLHAVRDGYAQGQGIGRAVSKQLPVISK